MLKTKGQQSPVAKPELLALALSLGGVAERSNAAACEAAKGPQVFREFESGPLRRLVSPVGSYNYQRGPASGTSPETGFTPTVILDPTPEESKVQNDVPQLQGRSREGGSPQSRGSALEVPTMRETFPGATAEGLRC
jgi:hypothetical protein